MLRGQTELSEPRVRRGVWVQYQAAQLQPYALCPERPDAVQVHRGLPEPRGAVQKVVRGHRGLQEPRDAVQRAVQEHRLRLDEGA